MKLLGAALLTAAGLLAGLAAAGELRARAVRRAELARMLERMEFELGRFATPMPVLFERLSGQLTGEAGRLCGHMGEALSDLDGRTLEELWTEAVRPLPRPEREALLPLGQVLGRYGAEEQLMALAACRARMLEAAEDARRDLRERGRMAVGIGAAGAAALAVLLL